MIERGRCAVVRTIYAWSFVACKPFALIAHLCRVKST
jgi:hypothetical protein